MDTTITTYIYGLLYNQPEHIRQRICEFYELTISTDHPIASTCPFFLRGFIEMNAFINDCVQSSTPICRIHHGNNDLLKRIQQDYAFIPSELDGNVLSFQGSNMVDFLGYVYTNAIINNEFCIHNNYARFMKWLRLDTGIPKCLFKKEDEQAMVPYKKMFSDVGYDLTIIRIEKKYTPITTLYDTGISVNIPFGFYAEIVPRSSLSKTGYMLANNVGIIDNSYRGRLYIPLIKVCPESPELALPTTCCQLIFKKQEFVYMEETDSMNATTRGVGGFGSTNKN